MAGTEKEGLGQDGQGMSTSVEGVSPGQVASIVDKLCNCPSGQKTEQQKMIKVGVLLPKARWSLWVTEPCCPHQMFGDTNL